MQIAEKLTRMVQGVQIEVDTSDVQIGQKLTLMVQGVQIGETLALMM